VAEAATDLAVPVGRPAQPAPVPVGLVATGRVDLVAQADLATTDPVDRAARVGQVITGLVAQADLATTDPVGPAARAVPVITDPAAQDSTDPVDRAVLVPLGTAMTIAATSAVLRGATDLDPGDPANRHDRHGTGRFRRPVDRGTTGRSTTGAIRKRRSGTRSSTSSDSTSSECGSRCK
jgi:hypothetical protein